jgi:hypothetical protein
MNSLGRLHALEQLPPETTVVYAAKAQEQAVNYQFMPIVLRSLGLRNPIIVTEDALRFEVLHTAPELFGECRGGRGEATFYDWIDRCWPVLSPPDPDSRIYVTRRGLGPQAGRFACEEFLERLLEAEGYEIYSPEAHPIRHQIETFQRAGKLIFAEGSALHLFSLVRQPNQFSAVIHRRKALPEVMRAQMADRSGHPTVAIDTVAEFWWSSRRGEHLSVSILNFDQLREELIAVGLIHGRNWQTPAADVVASSLREGLAPGEEIMDSADRAEWLKKFRKARRK